MLVKTKPAKVRACERRLRLRGSLTPAPFAGANYSATRGSCLSSLQPSNTRRTIAGAFSRPCCTSTLFLIFPVCTHPTRERLDEPRRTRKRPNRWGRLEMDVDIGNAGRMERSRDVAPTDLDGRLLTLSEIT